MKTDILIIGGGASGLMAAYQAARAAVAQQKDWQVTVLEKMPRAARKLMITGKGRCNFTNCKDWNAFSAHIRSKAQFAKAAFYHFPPSALMDFFGEYGMRTVVERGDRAFPASYRASDVVDTLVTACLGMGVKLEYGAEVASVSGSFEVLLTDGRCFSAPALIVATGGLSYPTTGSTGDGYRWAAAYGHTLVPTFPALTALVPRGYKTESGRGHIPRQTPCSELGAALCGISLKNIGLQLTIDGMAVADEFGDIDFTDGGLEGPVAFQLSRKAVKAMCNGSRAALTLDMKPGVSLTELTARIHGLWEEIARDARSARLREKERCRVLLGKLMPRELVAPFMAVHPEIITLSRRSRTETKVWVNLISIAKALKAWRFDLDGYVGYERAVITAGGINTDEVLPKRMESRLRPGLFFCGEVLDIDADTGGYNLQLAFCTGALAGASAVAR